MSKKINLHSHTVYSNNGGHADGTPNEIVEKAIALGFTEWGFTEHVPFVSIDVPRRTSMENMEAYIKEVNKTKEAYKDVIKVYCGFECEAIPGEYDFHNELLARDGVDFLILGNHFAGTDEDGKLVYFMWGHKNAGDWDPLTQTKLYVDSSIDFFENVDSKYMAHADRGLPSQETWTQEVKNNVQRLLNYTKENNIILAAGVNAFRFHKRKIEPSSFNPEFWKMAAANGNEVHLEVDYHQEVHLDTELYDELYSLLRSYGVNIINIKR